MIFRVALRQEQAAEMGSAERAGVAAGEDASSPIHCFHREKELEK